MKDYSKPHIEIRGEFILCIMIVLIAAAMLRVSSKTSPVSESRQETAQKVPVSIGGRTFYLMVPDTDQ